MRESTDAAIRVVIADDHAVVRRGTREILEDSGAFDVVGEAADGHEAVSLSSRLRPDVVLLDIGMPGLNGVEAARAISRSSPKTAVLVLSVHTDIEYVWGAIRAGATGYLLKDVDNSELIDAVVTVNAGGAVLHPALTAPLLSRLRTQESRKRQLPDLTQRELQTLRMAAGGLPNAEIAERLGVSPRTVEAHLGNAFKKLEVHNRTEAVITALRLGLVGPEDG